MPPPTASGMNRSVSYTHLTLPTTAAGRASEITEDTVRDMALPLGFVDVKVCAVDNTWSGLKLVVRKTLR